MLNNISSQIAFIRKFHDEDSCLYLLKSVKWPNGVICPFCDGVKRIYEYKDKVKYKGKWKCNPCNAKVFKVTNKTLFENTKIPLTTWFFLIYCLATNKKNFSSAQMAKNLGVGQKCMWYMMHEIRKRLAQDENILLEGVIEIDETYLAKGSRWSKYGGISARKAPVMGMVERGGRVFLHTVDDTKKDTFFKIILLHCKEGSIIYTDGHVSYRGLDDYFKHDFVIHSEHEYVRGDVHTNTIEAIWGGLKRSIRNSHHSISAKHAQLYCNEVAWKYNNRHLTWQEKFYLLIKCCLDAKIKKENRNEHSVGGKVIDFTDFVLVPKKII